MLDMRIVKILVVALFLFTLAGVAEAQNDPNSNIPTNPNDPAYPRDPNRGSDVIPPPPNKTIVIPDPNDIPRGPDNNPDTSPDRGRVPRPDNPNNPGRVPSTPDKSDPESRPEIPLDPLTQPETPNVPDAQDTPKEPVNLPQEPLVDHADPQVPRPDDQIPDIPELPDDPSLIQPEMETEYLTAPVFNDEMPEILGSDPDNYVPKQVLVLLNGSSQKEADIEFLTETYDLNNLSSSTLNSINATMVLFEIPDNRGVIDISRTLSADSRTITAQPNYYFETMGEENVQYGVSKIKADSAHSISTGKGVRVSVIDTGIDYSHDAIADNILIKSDFVGSDVQEFKPDIHGTAIAGIIASATMDNGLTGVAPDVKVIAARACWSDVKKETFCSSETLAKAIDYSIINKAQIINLSLGGPRDNVISLLLKNADNAGIVLVAAAGNGGANGKPVYPAALKEVIAVSATDYDDKLYALSTRGNYIDLSAPGVDILSPGPGNSWQIISGTSMAAAHVTGVIALLLQEYPELSPFQIRTLLGSTSLDLGKAGKDEEYGEGRIDALRALDQLNNPL